MNSKIVLFLLAYLCLALAQMTEFQETVHKEELFRKKINMTFDHYHVYPFAIQNQQEFVIMFHEPETITGQMFCYWIGENATLHEVSEDKYKDQYIELSIKNPEDLTIFQSKFHTQNAFKFTAQKDVKYRLKFTNFGKEAKMIDFATSYIAPRIAKDLATTENHKGIKDIAEELKGIFRHWEQSLVIKQEEQSWKTGKFRHFMLCSAWEMAVIFGVMIIQIYTVKKITNDYSIV